MHSTYPHITDNIADNVDITRYNNDIIYTDLAELYNYIVYKNDVYRAIVESSIAQS